VEIFFACIVVGFLGQMIDGSLGMAYGVSCNTFLLALGLDLSEKNKVFEE